MNAIKIATAIALVSGLLTGACDGQPLTDTKPSAFVEQFNKTTQDVFEDPTGLQFKKYSPCAKTGDGKKGTCTYSGKYGSMELNTRENGSVWRAEIRIVIPKGDENEAYRRASIDSCTALFKQTSGLSADDALQLFRDLKEDKEVGGIHYFFKASMYRDAWLLMFCGAADTTPEKDDIGD